LGTANHDYERSGTITLFAALDALEGRVSGRCMQRRRHQEFIHLLDAIVAEMPAREVRRSSRARILACLWLP